MLTKSSCQELDPESQETVTPRDRWKRVVSKLLERNLIPKVDESKKVSRSLEKLVSSWASFYVDTKLVIDGDGGNHESQKMALPMASISSENLKELNLILSADQAEKV
ncbi:hypothetical protein ACB092_01G216000 [Castanea dentata]